MKLDRMRCFDDEIKKDALLAALISTVQIYYFFNGNWHNLSGSPPPTKQQIINLEKTRALNQHWRPKRSVISYFPRQELDCVIEVTLKSRSTEKTRDFVQLALNNSFDHGENAFRASYDTLTELRNRYTFEHQLTNALTAPSPPTGSPEEMGTSRQVGLLAIDIDRFKQVNDTYGHSYGDVVLRCFARRLERISKEQEARFPGRIDCLAARFGGEEFYVLEIGSLSDDEVCSIADAFKTGIAQPIMPSEQEWRELETLKLCEGLTLPPDNERRVTCSVGVVTLGIPISEPLVLTTRNTLIAQADSALYKAKANGRDNVCFFPQIREQYGRVLQYHPDTDIVTIDIGVEVGVRRGQEFLVYHPDFNGGREYIHSDGRTQKKLGVYPRVPSGRIEAFEVQKEISFCRVLERTPDKAIIPEKAWLEAVPLGSISHLVKMPFSQPGAVALGANGLKQEVMKIIKNEHQPIAAVFRIVNETETIDKLGTASVNRALAYLHDSIRSVFQSDVVLAPISATEFAVVATDHNNNEFKEKCAAALQRAHSAIAGSIKFVVGIFIPNDINAEFLDAGKPDLSKAIELAQYTAPIDGMDNPIPITIFGKSAIWSLIQTLEKQRKYSQILEDIKKLNEYGINGGWLSNQAGRQAWMLGDYDTVLAKVNEAISFDSTDPTYFANRGMVFYRLDRFVEAVLSFKEAFRLNNAIKLANNYKTALAISAYRALSNEECALTKAQVMSWVTDAIENPPVADGRREELDKILHDLQSV